MNRNWVFVSLQALLLAAGCTQQANVDPESLALRKQLLVSAQATGEPTTISAVRLNLLEKKGSQSTFDVTIKGRIDANGFDPWENDRAVFAVTDASDEYMRTAKAHNHDDGDCPFCKHKSDPNQFMAMIHLVDGQGKVFPRSARGLLGLESKQTVVVQGQGTISEDDMLVVAAKSINVVK